MPTYVFLDRQTDELVEYKLKISEYDQFKLDNPHLERYIDSAPRLNYGGIGSIDSKTDNTWKEVLQKIGEQNPNSPLAERYNKKTIKRIKTDEVLEKHRKKQQERKNG